MPSTTISRTISRRHLRGVAAAAIALVAVGWGPAASSAPTQHRQGPVLISHLMSSCGSMSDL